MTYHVQFLLLVRQPLFDRAALPLTQTSWVLPPLSVGKMTLRRYSALNYSHGLSKGPSFGTGRGGEYVGGGRTHRRRMTVVYGQKLRSGLLGRPARYGRSLRVREGEPSLSSGGHEVPGAGRLPQRILCVARPGAFASCGARRGVARHYPDHPRGFSGTYGTSSASGTESRKSGSRLHLHCEVYSRANARCGA